MINILQMQLFVEEMNTGYSIQKFFSSQKDMPESASSSFSVVQDYSQQPFMFATVLKKVGHFPRIKISKHCIV